MPTTILYPLASADDGYIFDAGGGTQYNNNEVHLQNQDNMQCTPYIRFPLAPVPPHSTITNAFFRFTSEVSNSNPLIMLIYGFDEDNSTQVTGVADYGGRTKTTSFVSWTFGSWVIGNSYDSPDISTVIQEIIDRAGWAEDNALQTGLYSDGIFQAGNRTFYSFDNGAGIPELHLEWEPPITTVTLDPASLIISGGSISSYSTRTVNPDIGPVISDFSNTGGQGMSVSPGVYTNILDITTYPKKVPSTIAFIAGFSDKGEDNKLKYYESKETFVIENGYPNYDLYGKEFSQGMFCAHNYLDEAESLYWLRALPSSAQYANFRIDGVMSSTDNTASISLTYVNTLTTKSAIAATLATAGTTYPLCVLAGLGRGVYYNKIGIRLTQHANPILSGVFVLDIYERQSDGTDKIIESYEISFDPNGTDLNGNTIYIVDILNNYSSVLRAYESLSSGAVTPGYELLVKVFDKDIGTVSSVITDGSATITDNKQDFSTWDTNPETGYASYIVIAKDNKGNEIWGWLGSANGAGSTVNVFDGRNLDTATQSWQGDTSSFNTSGTITYQIKKSYNEIASAFVSSEPVPLRKGTDGTLFDVDGTINSTVATDTLEDAYSGDLDDQVLDTDNIYFSVVFDCGYPTSVKDEVDALLRTREDAMGFIDNGDNSTVNSAILSRDSAHDYDSEYLSLYEPYNKVEDPVTKRDIWVSPIYHMSYLVPKNDIIGKPWYAVAGFNRGENNSIKEMRFIAKQADRERFYPKQINPITKINNKYIPYSQLTTLGRMSPLNDVNSVRVILYCKRALKNFCLGYIFEQNDQQTWTSVATDISEFLSIVQQERGLDSYTIEVSATDYEKKLKKFHVNVTLAPTPTTEQISLNFFITR